MNKIITINSGLPWWFEWNKPEKSISMFELSWRISEQCRIIILHWSDYCVLRHSPKSKIDIWTSDLPTAIGHLQKIMQNARNNWMIWHNPLPLIISQPRNQGNIMKHGYSLLQRKDALFLAKRIIHGRDSDNFREIIVLARSDKQKKKTESIIQPNRFPDIRVQVVTDVGYILWLLEAKEYPDVISMDCFFRRLEYVGMRNIYDYHDDIWHTFRWEDIPRKQMKLIRLMNDSDDASSVLWVLRKMTLEKLTTLYTSEWTTVSWMDTCGTSDINIPKASSNCIML